VKILSIDYGEKNIGLAYADTSSVLIAQPLTILKNSQSLLKELHQICTDKNIELLILGYPRGLNGLATQQTRDVQAFGDKLKSSLGLPLQYQDETLSSVHVREQLSEDKKGNKQKIDDQAAALILQDYLEQEIRLHGAALQNPKD
jgi:putative Holliday junction resolvase